MQFPKSSGKPPPGSWSPSGLPGHPLGYDTTRGFVFFSLFWGVSGVKAVRKRRLTREQEEIRVLHESNNLFGTRDWWKPNDEKVEAILKLNTQENTKKWNHFSGLSQKSSQIFCNELIDWENYWKRKNHGQGEKRNKKIWKTKTNVNRTTMSSTLCDKQR